MISQVLAVESMSEYQDAITKSESMCDDCEMDYETEDKDREEFAQVLDEVDIKDNGYSPKVIGLLVIVGFCSIVLIGLALFCCVKIVF